MKKIILSIVIILFMFFIIKETYLPIKNIDYIRKISKKYDVSLADILALIKTESDFREKVVSNKGAVGVMQVMPSTAKWIVEKNSKNYMEYDLYNYKDNIEIGVMYYSYLDKKYNGDREKIFAAYNSGVSRVKNGEWKKIKETRYYVMKVKIYRIFYCLFN